VETKKENFMKIHKEGYGIIGRTLVGCIILFCVAAYLVTGSLWPLWTLWLIGGILALIAVGIAAFFREPRRKHLLDPDTVFSPADGKIVIVEEVQENEFLHTRCIQVSVFMSVANVHVNWHPVSGRVLYFHHHHGEYLVAWHPKSSEKNERTTTVVDTGRHHILFRQIAGYIARRIVNYCHPGDEAVQNTQFGFIKFGSRIDLFLPLGTEILVRPGDKVVGSQTPLARLA
jgi:phosphatidylserine decarboxylase